MQAFFENVCSASALLPPVAWPRPHTVHTSASYLANVCSWHSITNISFGSHANMAATLAASLKVPGKVCYSFARCLEGKLANFRASFAYTFWPCNFKIDKQQSCAAFPLSLLPLYFCMKITNLLSKIKGTGRTTFSGKATAATVNIAAKGGCKGVAHTAALFAVYVWAFCCGKNNFQSCQ